MKKKPSTPRSRVRQALRQVWLRSRERAAALKRDDYSCQVCHRRQSKAKGREFSPEVHHRYGICNWERVIDTVFEEILCDPVNLQTLCKSCHEEAENEPDPPFGSPAVRSVRDYL